MASSWGTIMKIFALGVAAGLAFSTSASAMEREPVHGLRIDPPGRQPCTQGTLPAGYLMLINTGTSAHPVMTKVSVFQTGCARPDDDRPEVPDAGRPSESLMSARWSLTRSISAGVCRITRDGEIDTSPGGSPVMDVTMRFDQPSIFGWPPGTAYDAIQSAFTRGPAPWCSLQPGKWAWPKVNYPDYQPSIDFSRPPALHDAQEHK